MAKISAHRRGCRLRDNGEPFSPVAVIKSGVRVTLPPTMLNRYGNIENPAVVALLKDVSKDRTDVLEKLSACGVTYEIV